MEERRQAERVDEIASELMMAEASDADSLKGLLDLLRAYLSEPPADGDPIVAQTFEICVELVEDILSGSATAPDASLQNVSKQITELQQFLREKGLKPIEEEAAETVSVPSQAPQDDAVEAVAAEAPRSSALPLTLPEWVDDTTFRDFLSTRTLTLDEIEGHILAIEKGDQSVVPGLLRDIHTIKGEAGALGLEGMEAVCHSIEDHLTATQPSSKWADVLFSVRDWLANAIEAYSRYQHPVDPAAKIIRLIEGEATAESSPSEVPEVTEASADVSSAPHESTDANGIQAPEVPEHSQDMAEAVGAEAKSPSAPTEDRPAVEPPPAKEQDTSESSGDDAGFASMEEEIPPEEQVVERDEETVALLAEFLQEGEEGLAQVDTILMNIESQGLHPENIDAIFRVFHTLKGVAGFLELYTIESLAHTTENLLNQSRKGEVVLAGAVLDLIFDSTESMRALLADVREGVETGRGIRNRPEVPQLVVRLKAAIDGNIPAEAPVPPVPKGTKVGEILVMTGATTKDEVDSALHSQEKTGKPLGEELVTRKSVAPKQVAQAIRTQKRAAEPTRMAKLRETVKVDLERVDSLVEMVGELVIVESMLAASPELGDVSSLRLQKYLSQLGKISRDLQSVGMQLRMIPLRGVFQKMARLVRDLSKKSHKKVRLIQHGESTEMDRSMVEQISDPLIHMIRNSVDHGIEEPENRDELGKPTEGTIELSAYHEGSSIVISIRDDGRGLNREAIVKKAVSQGLIRSGDHLSDSEVFNLIFAPGFSTAQQVTQISGRGVGMDVVKKNIDAMRGRIAIESKLGQGTEFRLILPLTLAIIDGMLVACGREKYIIPTLSIIESIQPTSAMLYNYAGKRELVNVRGEIMPLMRLSRLLGVADAEHDPTRALIIVIESLDQKIGLMVDDVLNQQQVVIKNLGSSFKDANYLAGATILSDGRAGLILNVDELGALAKGTPEALLADTTTMSDDIELPAQIAEMAALNAEELN